MYFENALNKINHINWEKFGNPDAELTKVEYLGYEHYRV